MKNSVFLLAALLMMVGCARNPVTGKRQLAISEANELRLGAQNDPAIVSSMGVYEDAGLDALLQRAGKQMAAKSHRPDLSWTFRIVDSEVVNAFAVPGGYVYFTRGILAHFNNEAEFAGVLGHEIGHVTARHSAQQIRKQQLAQVGMIAGVMAVPGFAQNFETISQGMQLLFLKYGRDAESESDALGVEYSSSLGYDANYMAGFFNTIDRIQKQAGAKVPDFLSTHPDPLNREANVRQLAGEWQQKLPGREDIVNRDKYLRLLEGLIYGPDPAQGFVEANVFYHPVLKFKFSVPKGWQVVNSPSQVQLGSPNQDGVVTFSLAQGNSSQAAAQTWVQQAEARPTRSQATTVNGNRGYVVAGRVAQEGQQPIAYEVTFIELGGRIYQFTCITLETAAKANAAALDRPVQTFGQLTDAKFLNRKPERVRIKTVDRNQSLKQFLTAQGTPASRLAELAILNGMKLNETVTRGMLVKTVSR